MHPIRPYVDVLPEVDHNEHSKLLYVVAYLSEAAQVGDVNMVISEKQGGKTVMLTEPCIGGQVGCVPLGPVVGCVPLGPVVGCVPLGPVGG